MTLKPSSNENNCGYTYKTDEEKVNGAVSIAFTDEIVEDDVRQYLRMLPMTYP